MTMPEFILMVTLMLGGAEPATVESRFESREACEAAMGAVLETARRYEAMIGAEVKDLPKVSAECREG